MENERPTAQELEGAVSTILRAIDDPTREGLVDTPRRYVKFLREFTNPAPFKFTAFDGEGTDEIIVQTGIPF